MMDICNRTEQEDKIREWEILIKRNLIFLMMLRTREEGG